MFIWSWRGFETSRCPRAMGVASWRNMHMWVEPQYWILECPGGHRAEILQFSHNCTHIWINRLILWWRRAEVIGITINLQIFQQLNVFPRLFKLMLVVHENGGMCPCKYIAPSTRETWTYKITSKGAARPWYFADNFSGASKCQFKS